MPPAFRLVEEPSIPPVGMRGCPQFPQSLILGSPSAALSPLPVSHILYIQFGEPFQCLASRVGRLHQHPSRNRVSFLNPFSAPTVPFNSPKSLLYGLLRNPSILSPGSQFAATAPPRVRSLHCFSHSWLTCQPYSDFCLDSESRFRTLPGPPHRGWGRGQCLLEAPVSSSGGRRLGCAPSPLNDPLLLQRS